ncbi:LuxR C-terminal-related transcriptional regulator [Gulosibacter sp. 10]|uniref:helix-turn-helix transcriptional regulator n=1 Tax=Gulosibacter sp. 10 TaxID=1255570 RepID=UPI00097EB6D1|nr:LuxR C-terminal-related transcriptional regulator [Gulosibacter sp. 10]SJM60611.1 transcriptional regulatory protein [Gulosibacter sp. 10]
MNDAKRLDGELIELLLEGPPSDEHRARLGQLLLDLFRADVFVSYTADETGPYARPIAVNGADDLLSAYDEHFRSVDWLTPQLCNRRRATAVVFPERKMDEFVHDFLRRRDMYFGMNYFPQSPGAGSIDLRLWRSPDRGPFEGGDVLHLQRVGDLIQRLWPSAAETGIELTKREHEVARMLTLGMSDKEICHSLDMALSTLRTHLRSIFHKTASPSRAAAAHWYRNAYSR